MVEGARQIKGTRPEGAVTETDASKRVREMFTQIAPRYDLLNHLLSLQLDRLWRARTARLLYAVLDRPDALVLDLCCGTGDLAFALARAAKARIIGADFAHPMLVRAREKSAAMAPPANQRAAPLMPFFEADALWLPFADASRSEEHTSELQSRSDLVCRLLLEKKKKKLNNTKQLIS